MRKRFLQWVLIRYKKHKQKKHTTDPELIEHSIRSLLAKTRYVFLTTRMPGTADDGDYCSTRYVQPIVEWDNHTFKIWVGTHAQSRKISEIKKNPQVTIAVGQEGDGANLIIYGTASLHTDDALRRKHWKSAWALFFPDGPTSEDAVLVCVKPVKLELMDFKRNITPEPFGLKPLILLERNQRWAI